jgi:inhibitor of KinA
MSHYHPYTIFPLGDAALTVEFGNEIDPESNVKVLQLFGQLQEARIPYITDLVPAYSALTVHFDVLALHRPGHTAFETMAEIIENLTEEKPLLHKAPSKLIEVPVCYEEDHAPDIYDVARQRNLSPEEVIAIHTAVTYRVYMLGFLPGFAYMGMVDEQLSVPRKATPRKVAAGAVGITGRQTGIYPFASPGGWPVIGQTPLRLFGKDWIQPSLFGPGDSVRFFSISEHEFKDYQRRTT